MRTNKPKGNPRIEDGFLMIESELIDALMKTRIAGEEMQCLLAIIRKTYGWHKKKDRISYSQLQEMTGLSRRSVIRAVRKLCERNILIKHISKNGNEYEFNKFYLTWKQQKVVSKMTLLNAEETTINETSKELGNDSEVVSKMTLPNEEELNNNEASEGLKIRSEEDKVVSKMTLGVVSNLTPTKYIILNKDISKDISKDQNPSLTKKEDKESEKEGTSTVSREKMLELIRAFCNAMGFQYGPTSIKVNAKPAKWLVEHYEIEQVIEAVEWERSKLIKEKKDPAVFIPNLTTVEKWLDNWLGLMNKEKEEIENRKAGRYLI